MSIWINGKEYIEGGTVAGSDYIAAGAGTPNVIDQSGGDVYITDDLEVDGYLQVGSGTPSRVAANNAGDAFITGDLEIDGGLHVDGSGISSHSGANYFAGIANMVGGMRIGSQANTCVMWLVNTTFDQSVLSVGAGVARQMIFADSAYYNSDFGHADAGFPVWYFHSDEDPGVDATEYLSAAHNGTNGVLQTCKGNLTVGSGSTSHSLNSNGDIVAANLEANGIIYVDNSGATSTQETSSYKHDGDDAVFSCGHGGYSFGTVAQSARGTVTFTGIPVADETLVINATTITFKADGSGDVDHCTIGADAAGTVTNLVATLAECSESGNLSAWDGAGDTVVIEWGTAGTAGNSIVFTEAATNVAVDGSGTLGGTHAGVAADTLLTMDEDALATFGGPIRFDSSLYWHEKEISMYAIDPGASGATATTPDANTVGGYQLDGDTEYLYFQGQMCGDWDAASDPVVTVTFECNADNSGGNAGDTIDFDLVAYMKGITDTATKSQVLSGSVTVGACAQYTMFSVDIPIDYDDGSNPVDAGDIIYFRLNLDTTDSEVDDVVVNHLVFKYKTAKVGSEV